MDENYSPTDPMALAYYQNLQRQQQDKDDLIRYQLDAETILENMSLDWQGLEEDARGNFIPSPDKLRIINPLGAKSIISFLKPLITRVISLSQFEEGLINRMTETFANNLTSFLCRRYEEFDLKVKDSNMIDQESVKMIVFDCSSLFYSTLMKAMGGGERDTIRKNYTHYENREINVPQKKPFFKNPLEGFIK